MSVQASGSLVLGGVGGPSQQHSNQNPLQSNPQPPHFHHHHHHQQQPLLDPITTSSGITVNLPQTPEDPNSLHQLGSKGPSPSSASSLHHHHHHHVGVPPQGLQQYNGSTGSTKDRILAASAKEPSSIANLIGVHPHLGSNNGSVKDHLGSSPPTGLKDALVHQHQHLGVSPTSSSGLIHSADLGSPPANNSSVGNGVASSGGSAIGGCGMGAAATAPPPSSSHHMGEEAELQSQEASSTESGGEGGKNGGKRNNNNHGRESE